MKSIAKVTLVGNIGADPVLRYTQSGKAVCNFSLATHRLIGDNQVTDWHRVVVWDKLAEAAEKALKRGDPVYVEGTVQNRDYTDREGVKRQQTEYVARELVFLAPKREEKVPETPAESSTESVNEPVQTEDIPF